MAFLFPLMILLLALIHFYHNRRIHPHSIYLSGAMAAMAVYFVSHYLFIYGPSVCWLTVFFGHVTPIHLLMGPFLYLYVRGVLTDSSRISRRDGLHFVPALLDLCTRVPYFSVPWSTKRWMAQEMIRDPTRLHDFSGYFFPSPSVALPLRLLSMIGYTAFCLWLVRRYQVGRPQNRQAFPKTGGTVIRFLTYLLGVCLFTELAFFTLQGIFLTNRDFTTGHIVSSPLMVLTFLGILSIPVIIQLHPEVLYGIPRWRDPEFSGNWAMTASRQQGEVPKEAAHGHEGSHEGNVEADARDRFLALASRIERTLAERKPYLDPDFSLDDLSRLMDVPKHHLYYSFNHILQRKFTQLRAEYRIRHALGLIAQGQTQEKTLEAIGLESGFSSRSSFITAFREVTGQTPREYLRSRCETSR